MGMCWLRRGRICNSSCVAFDEQLDGCRILFLIERITRSLESLTIALSNMERGQQ